MSFISTPSSGYWWTGAGECSRLMWTSTSAGEPRMISRILSGGKAISPALRRPELAETRRQVLRFAVIGCCCVGIDLLTYSLLTRAGLVVPAAKGIAYLVGMMAGFVGNKFWTFRSALRSWLEPL